MSNTQQTTKYHQETSKYYSHDEWIPENELDEKNMSNTPNNKTKAKYLHGKEAIPNLLMDERNNLDAIMSKHSTRSTQTKKTNGWNPN